MARAYLMRRWLRHYQAYTLCDFVGRINQGIRHYFPLAPLWGEGREKRPLRVNVERSQKRRVYWKESQLALPKQHTILTLIDNVGAVDLASAASL